VVVVQGNGFNRSAIATVVVVPLTSNLERASAPGNVRLTPRDTGLPKESVANVSSVVAIDRTTLTERVGHVSESRVRAILAGIDVVLGR
jgi:mRNA interferase MazF